MIEIDKNKYWDLLKEKEVSLAMIDDKKDKILRYKSSKTIRKTIEPGEGFCNSYFKESIKNRDVIEKKDVVITGSGDGLPGSAVTQPVIKADYPAPGFPPFSKN